LIKFIYFIKGKNSLINYSMINYKFNQILWLSLIILITTGCGSGVQTPVGNGALFTKVKSPVTATSNSVATKQGTSSCVNILGLFAVGDASIDAACKDGRIRSIKHVDQDSFSVLGLFSRYKTVVRGD
jgi:uncharacterized membrane protein